MLQLKCGDCCKTLPEDEFYADKSMIYRNGKGYRCKDCSKLQSKRWCEDNLEKCRELAKQAQRRLRARTQGYESLDLDNSVCAICSQEPGDTKNYLVTDHDHKTGKTRGVLCRRCNLALGNFQDDVVRLKAAIKYLKEGR